MIQVTHKVKAKGDRQHRTTLANDFPAVTFCVRRDQILDYCVAEESSSKRHPHLLCGWLVFDVYLRVYGENSGPVHKVNSTKVSSTFVSHRVPKARIIRPRGRVLLYGMPISRKS